MKNPTRSKRSSIVFIPFLFVCLLASCDSDSTSPATNELPNDTPSDAQNSVDPEVANQIVVGQMDDQQVIAVPTVVNGYYLSAKKTSFSNGDALPSDFYELDIANQTLSRYEENAGEAKVFERIFSFDDSGLIYKEETPAFGQSFESSYDSNNRLVSEQSYNTDDNGQRVAFLTSRHVYDNAGLKTSKIVEQADGGNFSTTEFQYDSNNRIKSTSLTSSLLTTPSVNQFTYSADGTQLLEVETVSSISDFSLGTSVFEYDSNGNVVSETEYSSDGVFRNKTTYEYIQVNSVAPNLVLHKQIYELETLR